jgi:Fe(3+) dicitrate transport protein
MLLQTRRNCNPVVSVNKLTANKATNNARQIFAQVVGLTINESSDGGLQLSIGRGLDPNRTSNFNTRQNGYDISADVLGILKVIMPLLQKL